ncbi:hypothetical protein DID78_02290 [Candidatus Marinamargulisbacteria bacterium SCGC AG-343-D04]|nr:hypothetical protein DID78_02290 [Candidatus Marinamargulisbacteria bacterium SCGC AG-343-D04]
MLNILKHFYFEKKLSSYYSYTNMKFTLFKIVLILFLSFAFPFNLYATFSHYVGSHTSIRHLNDGIEKTLFKYRHFNKDIVRHATGCSFVMCRLSNISSFLHSASSHNTFYSCTLEKVTIANSFQKHLSFHDTLFIKSTISSSQFTNSSFKSCLFSKTKIKNTVFYKSSFTYCSFNASSFQSVLFLACTLDDFTLNELKGTSAIMGFDGLVKAAKKKQLLSHIPLQGISFHSLNLSGIRIQASSIKDCIFFKTNFKLSSISLSTFFDTRFNKASFYKATLTNGSFSYSTLTDVDFSSSVLKNMTFKEVIFKNVRFNDSVWGHLTFDNCTFIDCSFDGLKSSNVKLIKSPDLESVLKLKVKTKQQKANT